MKQTNPKTQRCAGSFPAKSDLSDPSDYEQDLSPSNFPPNTVFNPKVTR